MLSTRIVKYFCSKSLKPRYFLVTQTYVEDIYYRRIPFRKDFEKLLDKLSNNGNQIIGGMTFPYHSAYYLFNADDEKPVEEFLNQNVYNQKKLVENQDYKELEQMTQLNFDRLAQILTYK